MNIAAGSRFDYRLLGRVAGNLITMLLQLERPIGIATGRTSPNCAATACRRRRCGRCRLVSELAANGDAFAELVGGAIGLSLLFGIPLLPAMAVVGVATYAILLLDRAGSAGWKSLSAASS